MSASIVRKSLEIVDSDFSSKGKSSKKSKKNKKQNEILPSQRKVTVTEIRKKSKTKDQRLRENLAKLKLIKKICTIDLDKNVTRKIIKRGVTKKPVHIKEKSKKPKKTAFTEEDFAKFEQEYFNE
ncbi:hypothetical protein RN001_009799 [Aquatica leii]|uniref:Active regulator of SIRT1 n=1 Tax=Aquatica leii TaxID=1421715 RepID=A0AAN7QGT7_9COLE|nr:hypothetical protein RN001_009799 [Aquatica leii]